MATAALAGYKGIVKASTSTGGSETKVGAITDYTLTAAQTTYPAMSHDSSGEMEHIAGHSEWSADVEFQWEDDKVSQVVLYDLLKGLTAASFSFMPVGSSSGDHWTGDGFITDWALTGPNEGPATIAASVQGSGTLTRTTST